MSVAALAVLTWVQAAFACPGSGACSQGDCPEHAAEVDPSSCARSPTLIGANCTFTTGMMAKRVVEEGRPWTFIGRLVPTENTLTSHVAAPFVAGGDVYVVANQVLERVREQIQPGLRLTLEGRLLEVEGVKYFVLTKGLPES